jgi:hypothetical protein
VSIISQFHVNARVSWLSASEMDVEAKTALFFDHLHLDGTEGLVIGAAGRWCGSSGRRAKASLF